MQAPAEALQTEPWECAGSRSPGGLGRCTAASQPASCRRPAPEVSAWHHGRRRPARGAARARACASVWSAGPLTRMVTLCGLRTPSTNVYFSSPSTCSYTSPAWPSASGASSSTLFTAKPGRPGAALLGSWR